MSLDTLLLLRDILGRQVLNVGDADFAEVAAKVTTALSELDAAIAAAETAGSPT